MSLTRYCSPLLEQHVEDRLHIPVLEAAIGREREREGGGGREREGEREKEGGRGRKGER